MCKYKRTEAKWANSVASWNCTFFGFHPSLSVKPLSPWTNWIQLKSSQLQFGHSKSFATWCRYSGTDCVWLYFLKWSLRLKNLKQFNFNQKIFSIAIQWLDWLPGGKEILVAPSIGQEVHFDVFWLLSACVKMFDY